MKEMTRNKAGRVLREETIPFPLIGWIVLLFALLAVMFFVLMVLTLTGMILGERPAPWWMYGIMTAVFGLSSLFIRNFRELRVVVTDRNVAVSYGVFHDSIPMETITASYVDTASALFRYGGWGLRFGRVEGRRRKVYNSIGYRNVVVRMTGRRIDELVFSSENPEAVAALVTKIAGTV
jgi:hypothetical protein